MKTILIIRRAEEYYKRDEIFPMCKSLVYSWNMFFRMKYIDFRKRMHRIASLSYSPNKFDKVYLWENAEIYKEVNRPGNIVMAIDDDDWFSHNLVEELHNFSWGEKPVVRWDTINIHYDGTSWLEDSGLCRSCSYATRMPYPTDRIQTNVYMSGQKQDITRLKKVLSVKVDHFGTQSYVGIGGMDSILAIVKKRHLVDNIELLQDYKFQVKLYNALLSELYESCKVQHRINYGPFV